LYISNDEFPLYALSLIVKVPVKLVTEVEDSKGVNFNNLSNILILKLSSLISLALDIFHITSVNL